MQDNRRGSVTIEAAVSLVAMIMIMLTMNMFIKVTYVHSMVQHALIQTANEMATYDYILSLLGINELNNALMDRTSAQGEAATGFTTAINTKIGQFDDVMKALAAPEGENGEALTDQSGQPITDTLSQNDILPGFDSGAINGEVGELLDFKSEVEELTNFDDIKSYVVDSDGNVNMKNLLESYLRASAGEFINKGKTAVFNVITKALFSTYIQTETSIDKSNNTVMVDALKKNLVVNGINGLDFSKSKYFEYPNTDSIELSCSYVVKVVAPIPVIEYIPLHNTVKVRAWQDKWESVDVRYPSKNSVWYAGLGTGINSKIVGLEFGSNQNVAGSKYAQYKQSTKTLIKATCINIADSEYPDEQSLRNEIQGPVRMIRNYNNSKAKTLDGKEIKIDDIDKATLILYVPSASAAESLKNSAGKDLGALKTELSKENAKDQKDENKIKALQDDIKELEAKIKEEKKKITDKTKIIKKQAEDLENGFNDEGNEFPLEIVVKAVDYSEA